MRTPDVGPGVQRDGGEILVRAPKTTRRLLAIGVIASVIVALTSSLASAAPIMRSMGPIRRPFVNQKIQVNFLVANPLQACGIAWQIKASGSYIATILSYGIWTPCYKNLSVTIDNVSVENGSNIQAIAWSGQGFAVSHYRCSSDYVAFAPVINLSCTLMKI